MIQRRPSTPALAVQPEEAAGEPTMAQLTRGLLLCLLADAYPKSRPESGLKAEVAEVYGDVRGWDQHVAYLADDHYLDVEDTTIGTKYGAGFRLRALRLTTRGIDLVDGTIRDSGVHIPR